MGLIRTVRNPTLSLFQSAVDDLVSRAQQDAEQVRPHLGHPMVLASTVLSELAHEGQTLPDQPPPEVAALGPQAATTWTAIRLLHQLFQARLEGNNDLAQKIEDDLKASTVDPGWIEALAAYVAYFGPDGKLRDVPYVRHQKPDDFVLETLPPNATVVVIGDWGSGTDNATEVMAQVARWSPDVVFHLGDIYYSGTERETKANFLDICNRVLDRSGGKAALYTLTGNHDMYCGGGPYYQLLSELNPTPPYRPEQAQPASYFAVRNSAWQFLSMDTGLHDRDPFTVAEVVTFLEDTEAAWHLDKINRFHAARGRTILLSHHQLFSAYNGIGKLSDKSPGQEAYNPKLLATFQDVLAQGKVAAWFWGHEHNLEIYEPYGPINKGRCIGHGAIPVFAAQTPYQLVEGIPSPPRLVSDPKTGQPVQLGQNAQGVYNHGYVLLKLNDAARTAEVSYYDEGNWGAPLYTETLP